MNTNLHHTDTCPPEIEQLIKESKGKLEWKGDGYVSCSDPAWVGRLFQMLATLENKGRTAEGLIHEQLEALESRRGPKDKTC